MRPQPVFRRLGSRSIFEPRDDYDEDAPFEPPRASLARETAERLVNRLQVLEHSVPFQTIKTDLSLACARLEGLARQNSETIRRLQLLESHVAYLVGNVNSHAERVGDLEDRVDRVEEGDSSHAITTRHAQLSNVGICASFFFAGAVLSLAACKMFSFR